MVHDVFAVEIVVLDFGGTSGGRLAAFPFAGLIAHFGLRQGEAGCRPRGPARQKALHARLAGDDGDPRAKVSHMSIQPLPRTCRMTRQLDATSGQPTRWAS